MRSKPVLLVLLALSGSASGSQRPSLPVWLQAPQCSFVEAKGRESSSLEPGISVCDKAPGVISCDAANAVPFDVSATAACQARGLPWTEGERVRVRGATEKSLEGVVVEWLDISSEESPRVLARRVLGIDASAIVPKSPAIKATTVVRFLRTGAAPVSFRSDEATLSREFVLPEPTEGAELFVTLPAVTFQPWRFRVVGGGTDRQIEPAARPWFRLGLGPGAYQIVPEYVGGMAGSTQSASGKAGETTFVRVRLPMTGALEVKADEALCTDAGRIEVSGAGRVASGGVVARDTFVAPLGPGCGTRLEGLPPGGFTVVYQSAIPGVRTSDHVSITVGTVTQLTLSSPGSMLVGHVLRKGQPLDGKVEISLLPKDAPANSSGAITALVDPTGRFRMKTDRVGEHRATLRLNGSDIPGAERFVSLAKGTNTLDWNVSQGRLRVRILNWTRSAPVKLILRAEPTSEGAVVESQLLVGVTDPLPVVLEALELQTYRLQAIQDQAGEARLTSAVIEVTPDPESASDVSLELREQTMTVAVIGTDQTPIGNAVVTIGEGAPLQRRSDGLFELGPDGSPGMQVIVSAPGYVPTCVIAPQAGTLRVTLQTGPSGVIHFVESPFDLAYPPGRLMWAGLACPVPFKRFNYTPSSNDKSTGSWTFGIAQLPNVDVVRGLWSAFDSAASAEAVSVAGEMRVSLKRYK